MLFEIFLRILFVAVSIMADVDDKIDDREVWLTNRLFSPESHTFFIFVDYSLKCGSEIGNCPKQSQVFLPESAETAPEWLIERFFALREPRGLRYAEMLWLTI